MNASTPRIYKVRDVMIQLQVSKATVYRWVNEGRLQLVKVGPKSSGITVESVNALFERGVNATPKA